MKPPNNDRTSARQRVRCHRSNHLAGDRRGLGATQAALFDPASPNQLPKSSGSISKRSPAPAMTAGIRPAARGSNCVQ